MADLKVRDSQLRWSRAQPLRAAARILTRRAVRRRGKTGSPHGLGDPRSSLRELRGGHVPSPFYPAARVSRRSQARLSERALRREKKECTAHRSGLSGGGRHAAAANLRAARHKRQTGKHFAGETAGQVTDLVGSPSLGPQKCFPAPSSGSPSRMSLAAVHGADGGVGYRIESLVRSWGRKGYAVRWPSNAALQRPGMCA